jgi:hypothetical protein
MLKRFALWFIFCTAVANAGVIYSFAGNTGPVLGNLQMAFQYTAPGLLTPGEFLFVLQADLNYSSPGGSVGFAEETLTAGEFSGQTFSSLNVTDAANGTLYPFTFPQGAFTAIGTYQVLDSSAAPAYPGMTGTLIVGNVPEPFTGGVCMAGLALLALVRLRRMGWSGDLLTRPSGFRRLPPLRRL